MLVKSPLFLLVAVVTLGLGIGANTAVFTLFNAVLLRLLPVNEPQELMLLLRVDPKGRETYSFSYPFYREVRDRFEGFGGTVAWAGAQPSLSIGSGGAERVTGITISGNYFEVLGVRAAVGRLIAPEDDRKPGGHPVIVLSNGFWQQRFGGDSGVVGSTVRVNMMPMTVIGVAPAGFHGLDSGTSPDVFLPMMMRGVAVGGGFDELEERQSWWLRMVGRLKPGVSSEQAAARLHEMYGSFHAPDRAREPAELRRDDERVLVLPASRGTPRMAKELSKPLGVMMGAVAVVLLIACGNLASLLLARAAARQREMAIRLALGAGRGRLVRQLLTESLLLALLGGFTGWLAAPWVSRVIVAGLADGSQRRALELSPDWRVFGFTLAATVITGLLFGLAPALAATRRSTAEILRIDTPQSAGTRLLGRKLVLAGQVALALTLVASAAMFVRSLHHLRTIDLGFRKENVLMLTLDPTLAGYDSAKSTRFYSALLERIRTLPGVESASMSTHGLVSGAQWSSWIEVEGHVNRPREEFPLRSVVAPGFLRTMGMPVRFGRDFNQSDNATAPRVAIVNEAFGRRYFSEPERALGKWIRVGEDKKAFTIVGVVKDGLYTSLREAAVEPFWFIPHEQHSHVFQMTLHVRTRSDPGSLAAAIRSEVEAADRNVPVSRVRTLEAQIDDDLQLERLIAKLATAFGMLALLLAALGLYGVVSFLVGQRRREIGVRMALGARPGQVVALVMRDCFGVLAVGSALGLAASLAVARWIESLLFGPKSLDAPLLGATAAFVCAISLVAAWAPARRAAWIDPASTLRHD